MSHDWNRVIEVSGKNLFEANFQFYTVWHRNQNYVNQVGNDYWQLGDDMWGDLQTMEDDLDMMEDDLDRTEDDQNSSIPLY